MSGPRAEIEPDLALLERRNLRDLGGLPTRDHGHEVAPRGFFRSSAACRFEADEQRALSRLKPRSAIDLRMRAQLLTRQR